MIRICNPKQKPPSYIDTTSRSSTWSRGLSPFFLGPVDLYHNYRALNVENGWQFSKLYAEHADENGDPKPDYFDWAINGWSSQFAHRYPMGRGAKPLCSYWAGEKLSYIEARKRIYAPLYARAVEGTTAFHLLQEEAQNGDLWLWDFDGYDHVALGMSFEDVLSCEAKKMGHAFVLAMMLAGERVWES